MYGCARNCSEIHAREQENQFEQRSPGTHYNKIPCEQYLVLWLIYIYFIGRQHEKHVYAKGYKKQLIEQFTKHLQNTDIKQERPLGQRKTPPPTNSLL